MIRKAFDILWNEMASSGICELLPKNLELMATFHAFLLKNLDHGSPE